MVTYVDIEKEEEALQVDISDTIEERRFVVPNAELLRVWKKTEQHRHIASSAKKPSPVPSTIVADFYCAGPVGMVCLIAPKTSEISPVSSVSPASSAEDVNSSVESSSEVSNASAMSLIGVSNSSAESSLEDTNESGKSSTEISNASPSAF